MTTFPSYLGTTQAHTETVTPDITYSVDGMELEIAVEVKVSQWPGDEPEVEDFTFADCWPKGCLPFDSLFKLNEHREAIEERLRTRAVELFKEQTA